MVDIEGLFCRYLRSTTCSSLIKERGSLVWWLGYTPPTFEVAVSDLGPAIHVGKLAVTCQCSVVYSEES